MSSALLIIDMINDFVHDDGALTVGKPAQAIVPYICDLATKFLARKEKVFLINDWHHEADNDEVWPKHAISLWGRTPYGPLNMREAICFDKRTYNAFNSTIPFPFDLCLSSVDTVHLCGVCTDICVFATAMGAFDLGLETVVHARGCATFTANHRLFLDHMKLCFKTEIVE